MYIYVAAPYSGGSPSANVRDAHKIGHLLIDRGYTPFVPHAYHFWDLFGTRSYEEWMEQCFAWVHKCDAVLRLPGTSPGADREVELAKKLDKPVFFSISDIPPATGRF